MPMDPIVGREMTGVVLHSYLDLSTEVEWRIVREVLDALQRMQRGEYGRCDSCDEWIAKARLEAVPHARNCIACQREAEEEVA